MESAEANCGTDAKAAGPCSSYVQFDLVKDDLAAVRRIKWAQIKSADRAIEKMVRLYHQVRSS